jgi:pseudouridine-5'-monophosphatase
MRVVWVPHPELKKEYIGRENEVLAGRTGEGDGDLGEVEEVGDGYGDHFNSLEDFPYEKYGIIVNE